MEYIKRQLQQDITNFDKQIQLLDTQIKQLIGAKVYAKQLLDKIEKGKIDTGKQMAIKELKKEGKL